MKSSLSLICKTELIKLIKRKDLLSILALVAISILFGMAVLSDSYIGESNQSAVYWVYTQLLNSSILFVTPVIFGFIGSRSLAAEIENGSISLYTIRFRNRKKLYIGKSLAAISFATLFFIITCIINIIIYYALVCRNSNIASGLFWSSNTLHIIISIIALYLTSFILSVQFSLFLSAFFKPTPVIGIVFIVTLILHNTFKIPYIRKLNPWYYIVSINESLVSTSQSIGINYTERLNYLIILVCLSLGYIFLFNILAIKRFKDRDL